MCIHHYTSVLALCLLTSCSSLTPRYHVPNGCVITATNYEAALEAKHALDPTFHSRILIVGYTQKSGMKVYHAYCVWRTKDKYYAYDHEGTTRVFPTLDGRVHPLSFARQLHRTAFEGYFEGEFGMDFDFENKK